MILDKLFKRNVETIKVTSERCVTETEFEKAVDDLVASWSKAIKAAEVQEELSSKVKDAVMVRVSILEYLHDYLFEGK